MSFIDPVKYGKLENETSKTKTYSPEPSDRIVAPYDGVVYDTNLSKCDGFIQIGHLIGGKIFYSEICGVDKGIYVAPNVTIRKGDVIGASGGKQVNYEIKDSSKNKVDLNPFFTGAIEQKSGKENKIEPETEKDKKDSKNTKSDETEKEPKDKKGWDFTNIEKPKELPNLFTSLMLTPFYAIEKGLTSKKKKETKEEEQLQEQLNKIKRLIK